MVLPDIRRIWGIEKEERMNIGILTGASGLVVVDADNIEYGRELYRRLPKTDMMTKTTNGVHFFYRAPDAEISPRVKATILGVKADIRAGTSYVVGPGSIHPTGQLYERLGEWNLANVPEFDPSWIEEPSPDQTRVPELVISDDDQRMRAKAYIGKIRSISGQGGDRDLFRAACVLIQMFNLSNDVAMDELRAWNATNAEPPWDEGRLAYKIKEAERLKCCTGK